MNKQKKQNRNRLMNTENKLVVSIGKGSGEVGEICEEDKR